MADLSPQAQAVVDAFRSTFEMRIFTDNRTDALAAALRAAILNVFYEETLGMTAYDGYTQALEKILAIAHELETHQ